MLARIIIESILVFACALIGGGCAVAGFSMTEPIARIIFGTVGLVNTAAAMMLAAEARGWIEMYRARQAIRRAERALAEAVMRAAESMTQTLQDAQQRAEEERAVRA